jgi:hypothetical protein
MLIASINVQSLRIVLVCMALFPAVGSAVAVIALSRDRVAVQADVDARLIVDERLADWYLTNRAPGETMYVFCASAAFYGNALQDPPFPYLWLDGVRQVPGARQALATLLSSPTQRPTFVARYQTASTCDSSGDSARALDTFYVPLTKIRGVQILVRSDR